MAKRNLFLMSSSAMHGFGYLEHAQTDMTNFLKRNSVQKVLFIPYALTDYDGYTERVGSVLKRWGFSCNGIHTFTDPVEAVKNAEAIYIGGGNTFLLLRTLYEKQLVEPIRDRVLKNGVPYVGSSAGTNVATRSIQTTNDMPIVHTPTFDALALVPFNINPHYIDPDANGKHMGETRAERIKQFHELNDAPVLGLREGTTLFVNGDNATLIGPPAEAPNACYDARLFRKNQEPAEYAPSSNLNFLLKENA
ncbi:probable alpha-aspartyl dipeptidase [Anopheles moucheti]|uniref:probable alpha-aspartyl dipeptidase n=1 Tax=Anopheles moucheti TaxID=186751 RepID=UPI0022F09FAA|nr:probable alpha-aspartyl dipeptidase [Anopheles moucheti]XP_052900655.1 probable alpha-aspartyl dipeptidase [Anopheles moucheti]